jgi:glucokinase
LIAMGEPWVLGMEIGGTKLQLGLGRGRGDLAALERLAVVPSCGAAGILEQIRQAFPNLLRQLDLRPGRIPSAAVGFGGPVDDAPGRIQRSYQVPGWEGFPLRDWIAKHLEIPRVIVQNDADTAGLAEARFGAGRGCSPLLYLTVGSGIGGALIIEDRIYRGFGKGAGEIGHLLVPDTTADEPRWLELEQVASGWAIARAAQDHARRLVQGGLVDWVVLDRAASDPDRITTVLLAQAAAEGDSRSAAFLTRAQAAIAFALVQVVALLAPRRIIIGGGVSLIGEEGWFDPIRRLVDRDVFPPFRGGFEIVPAALGEQVVVHGALALARDALTAAAG